MFDSFFDLPLVFAAPIIIGALIVYGVIGVLLVRRYILPKLRIQDSDSGFSSAIQGSVMVFYGLAAALIVVNVWQNYSDVAKSLSQEATAAATVYRELGNYPDPIRSELQQQLRDYVRDIIEHAWPAQQHGKIPGPGAGLINTFEAKLVSFEPTTEGQKILHAETLRAHAQLIQARRLRLDGIHTQLPSVLWVIIIAGALISLSSAFFFRVEDLRLQGIQVALLATFMGMIIIIIFAFDRPFRGELGLRPDSYQLVYDQLMKPH